jgi:5-methylcytosine-specific restriction endonuclease McrA
VTPTPQWLHQHDLNCRHNDTDNQHDQKRDHDMRPGDPRNQYNYRRKRRHILAEAEASGLTLCTLCRRPLDWTAWHQGQRSLLSPEVDHIVPISLGGNVHADENLRVICHDCNLRRGNRLFTPSSPSSAPTAWTVTRDPA